MNPSRIVFALAALCFTSCGHHDEVHSAVHDHATADKLEPYTCGDVERIHTLNDVFLASQPTAADFELASQQGIATVIDLRTPGEVTDFDEPAVVEQHGMTYVNLAFKAPDSLTDEVFDEFRKQLGGDAAKPILVHCGSANRVGAVWLAQRVLDGGLGWDEALAEAKTVGLRTPAYEEKAKEYIERKQSK